MLCNYSMKLKRESVSKHQMVVPKWRNHGANFSFADEPIRTRNLMQLGSSAARPSLTTEDVLKTSCESTQPAQMKDNIETEVTEADYQFAKLRTLDS